MAQGCGLQGVGFRLQGFGFGLVSGRVIPVLYPFHTKPAETNKTAHMHTYTDENSQMQNALRQAAKNRKLALPKNFASNFRICAWRPQCCNIILAHTNLCVKFRIGIPVVSSCLLGFVICDKTGSKEQKIGVYKRLSHLILVFVLGDRNVAINFGTHPFMCEVQNQHSSCFVIFARICYVLIREHKIGVYERTSHLILVFVLGDRNIAT